MAAGPDTAPLIPRDRSADTARLDRISVRLGSLRQSLELLSPSAEPTEMAEISLDETEKNLRWTEEQSSAPLKRRQQLMEHVGELTVIGEQMAGYRGLEIPLDRPSESSFLHFVTGTLPAEKFEKLEVGDNVALLPMPERNGRQLLVAMTTRQNRAVLERALQQAGFQPETLPIAAGATTETMTEQNERELDQVTAELKQVNAALQKLAEQFAPALDKIEQLINIERRLCEAEQNFPRTETAILLTGWMPRDTASEWEQRLREITNGRCVIATTVPEKTEEEQIPVLLRHSRLLRPFEMLVSAYGLPNYRELEPTLFVALSYLLMFGIMFGDVGDGFILAAGGLFALCLSRKKMLRDAGLLLLFGGVSSMAFGVIYGSYFGIPALKKFALWHDPLDGDPMRLMAISIEIGIVLISIGLILNVLNRFRRGDRLGGCLDKFGLAGILFYWGMLALVVNYAAFQSCGLVKAAFVLFFAVPVLCWMLKEPVQFFRHRHAGHPVAPGHGLYVVFMESLVEVFEGILAYFSNTISFVRLAAYAMSHAALLVATFMVAEDIKHFSPGGGLLSIGVIIVGNVIALVLEGIVCSVQALRLEYYEFFSKFFSGGGQPFKPFRLFGGDRVAAG
jgi:V/A-type H+-transporting ATPase subunit I